MDTEKMTLTFRALFIIPLIVLAILIFSAPSLILWMAFSMLELWHVRKAAKIADPTERLARLFEAGQWPKRGDVDSHGGAIMGSMHGFGVDGGKEAKERVAAAQWIRAVEGAVADGAKPFEAKFKLGAGQGSYETTPVEWACRVGAVGIYKILARGLDPKAPWGLGCPDSFGWLLTIAHCGHRDPHEIRSNAGRSEIIESIFDSSPRWSAQPVRLYGGGEDLRQFVARSRSYGMLRMKAWELLRLRWEGCPVARIAWAIGAAAEHGNLDPDMEQIRGLIKKTVEGMGAEEVLETWSRALAAAHEEHLGKADEAALRSRTARKDWRGRAGLLADVPPAALDRRDARDCQASSARISKAAADLGLGPWLRSQAAVVELARAIERPAGPGQSSKGGRL